MKDGQFIYPAVFLLMAVLSRREGNDATKSMLGYLAGLCVAILQIQASVIAVRGPVAFALPQWFVPGFVAGLAAIAVADFFNFALFRTEERSQRAPDSPRSPRSLIKGYVASPEVADEDQDGDEAESTPVKRRGRSPAKRKTPARKAARAETPSPRRSPRRSRTPKRR